MPGLPRNHCSLETGNDVQTLCKPLFNKTELSYFHYARMYDDGRLSVLVNNTAYHQHFWEQGYNKDFFPNYKEGVFFNEPCATRGLYDAKHFFNIDHMLMLIKRRKGFYEVSGFATHAGNDKILEFYLSQKALLENFVLYFKNKAQPLIQKAQQDLLFSEGYQPKHPSSDETNYQRLHDKFRLENYELIVDGNVLAKLPYKKVLLLSYLAQGYTSKEIAIKTSLSPRTIECYLSKLREDLSCTTNQLKELFKCSDLTCVE